MKSWAKLTLGATAAAFLLAGCATKKEPEKAAYIAAPLIVADAIPVLSSTKRSIGVQMDFKNISAASYQFARFKVTGYDDSGQSVRPKKGNRDSAYLRIAGPVSPGQSATKHWTNTWPSNSVRCLKVEEVEIVFLDGSVEVASASSLLNNQGNNICL